MRHALCRVILSIFLVVVMTWAAHANRVADERLMSAAARGDVTTVKARLAAKADQNAHDRGGETPLLIALLKKQLAVAQVLLAAKADPNADDGHGRTPLLVALATGQLPMVQALLAAGADPNLTIPGHFTPLTIASDDGYADIVDALLAKGADVNAKDGKTGVTALEAAVASGHRRVIEALLKAKADVNLKDNAGMTALILAISEPDAIDVVRALLASGADVNTRTPDGGATPLLLAVAAHEVAVVRALLETGRVELDARGKTGETARDLASRLGDAGIIALFDSSKRQPADHAATPSGDDTPPDYSALLSMLTSRVEKELPTKLPSGLFEPVILVPLGRDAPHFDSDGQTIPPFLILPVDLVKMKNGEIGEMLVPGIKVVREFFDQGLDFGGHKADAFLILSNFPIFEHTEDVFFNIIKKNKYPSVRAAITLALRHDVFGQGKACNFLSKILTDDLDLDVQYAAMLALASSDQLAYLSVKMDSFQTDEILSNIDALMHKGFQLKQVVPIARVLSRSPYIQNPKVRTLREYLRDVKIPLEPPAQQDLYEELLKIIDEAKQGPEK